MNEAQYQAEIRLGRAAQAIGNLAKALGHFEAAIALAPERADAYLWAGDAQLSAGNNALAMALANTGLALPCSVGQRSFGLQVRTLCLLRQQQLRSAGRPSFGLRMGIRRQLKRSRLAEAAAAAQEAVQNQPNNPGNHHVQAQVFAEMEKPAAADVAFRQALSLGPENVAILRGYASFLKTQWRVAEAREMAERAIRIEPGSLPQMLVRGQIAFAQDDLVTARDMALWALSHDAMNRQALELLALVKSRQSFFTGPYWWFKAFVPRLTKVQITLLFVAFVAFVVAVKVFVPASVWAALPSADVIKNIVIGGLVAYVVLCSGHVMILVERERRRVKLKKY
jgi:tetratricopeptide (TPR) repeat protein